MFDALNYCASGFEATQRLNSEASQNRADMCTPGAGGGKVQIVESPTGRAFGISNAPAGPDPTKRAEDLLRAQVLYAANAEAIDHQNQTFGNMINMLDTDQTQAPDEDGDSVL